MALIDELREALADKTLEDMRDDRRSANQVSNPITLTRQIARQVCDLYDEGKDVRQIKRELKFGPSNTLSLSFGQIRNILRLRARIIAERRAAAGEAGPVMSGGRSGRN